MASKHPPRGLMYVSCWQKSMRCAVMALLRVQLWLLRA